MRSDMFKVIVERPRRGKSTDGCVRQLRDDLDGPDFLGMRIGYGHRWLNENLAPLRRYLQSQVNRPWDKVYGDLRTHIDSRSTVKQHILQHLSDFVAINTYIQNNEIWCSDGSGSWHGGPKPLKSSRQPLFVKPSTGILLPNKFAQLARVERKEKRIQASNCADRRRVIGDTEQLLLLNGIWYRVAIAKLQCAQGRSRPTKHWCAIRKALVSFENGDSFAGDMHKGNNWLFGAADLYAVSKQQLAKRELRTFNLRSSGKRC
jgi:hypothetical protein